MKRLMDEDGPVINNILDGDTDSFEILLRKYDNDVAAIVATRVPCQDVCEVTQDVFIRAYKSLSKYSGKEPFRHWLKVIAVRTCHDFWRARYRNREMTVGTLSESTRDWLEHSLLNKNEAFSLNDARRVEIRELLDWALNKLKPVDRMIVLLVYFDGHSIRETAKLLGLSQTNVKVRSFRARNKLRNILKTLFP